jgi:hypothetical protein
MATLEETDLEAAMQKSERATYGWRYEIQHGPDGEANYAWLYRGNEMIATMKTHHAAALTAALAAQTQKGVEVPVAWRCKDFADGWILDHSERSASEYQRKTGCLVQPLFCAPPSISALIENLPDERIRFIVDAKDVAAGRSRIRSALVDVPAVESEPDGWLCSAPPGVWSSGRVDTDNANVQAWRDRDYTCIPYWLSPSIVHPPRSLSNEGDKMLHLAVAAVLEADTEFRAQMMPGWDGDPLSDELDGLRRIFTALSTRKGSSEGDGSATITFGGDHG